MNQYFGTCLAGNVVRNFGRKSDTVTFLKVKCTQISQINLQRTFQH